MNGFHYMQTNYNKQTLYTFAPRRWSRRASCEAVSNDSRDMSLNVEEWKSWRSTDIGLQTALEEERALKIAKIATAVDEEVPVNFETHHIESWPTENEAVIATEI